MKRILLAIALSLAVALDGSAATNLNNAAVTRRNLTNATNSLVQTILAQVGQMISASSASNASHVTSTHASFDGSSNIVFTVNGRTYSYETSVSRPLCTVDGLRVVHSTLTNVHVGALFVKAGGNYTYETAQCGSLPGLNESLYAWTNGQCVTQFAYSNGSEQYLSMPMGNSWIVQRMTNMVYIGEFEVIKTEISRTEAADAGITLPPVPTASSAPFRLMDLFVPRVYAASAASYAPGFVLKINVGSSSSPTWVDINLNYSFVGEYVNWDETYLTPSERELYYYSPTYYPTETTWNDYHNWITFPISISIPYYATDEDREAGNLSYQPMSLEENQFTRRFGAPTGGIPAFVEPDLCERDQTTLPCNKRKIGHRWKKCLCADCGTSRPHNLVTKGNRQCDRCNNRDGYEYDTQGNALSSGSLCNETKAIGGTEAKSAIAHHHGWHDSDGIAGNEGICSCECGDWQELHVTDGASEEIETWTPGYKDASGQISQTAKFHHGTVYCKRGTGDDRCSAQFFISELHTKDPDSPSTYAHSNVEGCHICYYTCSKCQKDDLEETEAHYQDPTQNHPCLCVCGEYFHDYDDNRCGSHTYSFCTRCHEPNPGVSQASFDSDDGHSFGSYVDAKEHICECKARKQAHYDEDSDGICDACSYVMSVGRGKQKKGPNSKEVEITAGAYGVDASGTGEYGPNGELCGMLPGEISNELDVVQKSSRVTKIHEECAVPWPNHSLNMQRTITSGDVTWHLSKITVEEAHHWQLLWFPTPVHIYKYVNDSESQKLIGKCYFTVRIDFYECVRLGYSSEAILRASRGEDSIQLIEKED